MSISNGPTTDTNNTRGWTLTFDSDLSPTYSKPRLRVVGATDTEPFATTWRDYHAGGYAPIHLPAGQKHPPPSREGDVQYTGEHGQPATVEKLTEWQDCPKNRRANIGISFCTTVTVAGIEYQLVGIDVDAYGDKHGGDQVAELVKTLGPLSDRDPWISSARTDGISGIRWFLVPLYDDQGKRIDFNGKADSAIDVIQRKHRFAVVWPSLHPDGGVYWWFPPGVVPDASGRTAWDGTDGLPVLSEFPVLSPSWVAYLTSDRRNDTSGLKVDWDTSNADLLKWAEDTFNDGNADKTCWDVSLAVTTWKRHIDGDPSSHDKITDSLWMLYRLASEGHTGWRDAADDIVTYWRTGVLDAGKRSPSEAEGEIWRSKLGALRKCKALVDAEQPVPAQCDCAEGGADIWHSPNVPRKAARQFAILQERQGAPVRRWCGDWYQYACNRWKLLDEDTLYTLLYDCFEDATCMKPVKANGVTTFEKVPWNPDDQKIRKVERALRTVVLLDTEAVKPPCWTDNTTDQVIPFRNGLVRVSDRKLLDHTPKYFNMWALPFDYDPVPTPTRWLRFLEELWPDDPESIEALQQWFGYVLSGRKDLERILFLIGRPRTGKGTILHVLKKLLGNDNYAEPTPDSFTRPFGSEGLIGKSLAIFDDVRATGSGKKFADLLKTISGRGTPSIERKNKTDWNGELTVRFIVCANERAHLPDSSRAIVGRMLPLQTTVSFADNPDRTLWSVLDAELPGIFNWALDGLDKLNALGDFTVPHSSDDMIDDMNLAASPVMEFIEDHCEVLENHFELDAPVYSRWKGWCEKNRLEAGSKNNFIAKVEAAYAPKIKHCRPGTPGNQKRGFMGIKLKRAESAFDPYDPIG